MERPKHLCRGHNTLYCRIYQINYYVKKMVVPMMKDAIGVYLIFLIGALTGLLLASLLMSLGGIN